MNIKYTITILLLAISSVCMAQSNLFDKYADMKDVTSIYISKKMFQLMPSAGDTGLKLETVRDKIESLNILTTSNKEQAELLKKDFSTIIKKNHEELMRIKDNDTHTTFHILQDGPKIKELIMLVSETNEFTIIHLTGSFTLEEIQKITQDK